MKVRKGEIGLDRFVVPFRAYGEASHFIVCVRSDFVEGRMKGI
jgi:hypothetical protein